MVGRDSILDLFQRSHGIRRDLLLDKMWDMKEGSERWLQVAGLTLNTEGDLYCHVRKLQEGQGWSWGHQELCSGRVKVMRPNTHSSAHAECCWTAGVWAEKRARAGT